MTLRVEKEVIWESSQAQTRQSEGKPMKKQNFHKKTEWCIQRLKDNFIAPIVQEMEK